MRVLSPLLAAVFLLMVSMACSTTTTSKGKQPTITESEPAMEEPSKAQEDVAAIPEPEPIPEDIAPAPEIQERKVTPEAEPEKSPLAAGQSLFNVLVEENVLKLIPKKITIGSGDTVRWRNKDRQKHFLASVPGSGPTDKLEIFSLMEPGSVFEHVFKVAGEYPYFCFIHNQMTGHITVTE